MNKQLTETVSSIQKDYGKGSIMRLDEDEFEPIETIPTGALSLDVALRGGIPRGRIIEIYGPESSGKTTLTLHMVAEAHKLDLECAFIDAEHAFDPIYAGAIGVDFSKLLFSQPDSGEQALEIVDRLTHSGEVALIVVDSVAALTPRAEIEGDMGDSHVGLQARLMSQACRKLSGIASKTDTTIVFINQLREKIGVMFGSPETTPGGRALKFYSSVRLDVRRKDQIKDGVEIVGNKTLVKVVKNKCAPPFKTAEFDIVYGEGISSAGCIIDLALLHGILRKNGAWIVDTQTGENVGNGREKSKAYLVEHEDYAATLYDQIVEIAGF